MKQNPYNPATGQPLVPTAPTPVMTGGVGRVYLETVPPPPILAPGPIPCAACGQTGRVRVSRTDYATEYRVCLMCKGAGVRVVRSSVTSGLQVVAKKGTVTP